MSSPNENKILKKPVFSAEIIAKIRVVLYNKFRAI